MILVRVQLSSAGGGRGGFYKSYSTEFLEPHTALHCTALHCTAPHRTSQAGLYTDNYASYGRRMFYHVWDVPIFCCIGGGRRRGRAGLGGSGESVRDMCGGGRVGVIGGCWCS